MHRTESPNTSDGAIENELAGLGKTAPRVTLADIEAAIASEHYFTAAQGWFGANAMQPNDPQNPAPAHPFALALLTFCVLVLGNGFTVTGESACVSPENFDAALGRKLARAKAVDKCWMLLGYEMRMRMNQAAIDRARDDVGTVAAAPPDVALYGDDSGPHYANMHGFKPQEAQKPPRPNTFMGMRFKLTGTLTDAPPGTPPGVATIGGPPPEDSYQSRVIAEKADLDAKLARLQAFLSTDTCLDLPLADRELLVSQASHMRAYAQDLGRRIERFNRAAEQA